jgi:hypothetical protein
MGSAGNVGRREESVVREAANVDELLMNRGKDREHDAIRSVGNKRAGVRMRSVGMSVDVAQC